MYFRFVGVRVPRRYSDDASRRAALYPFSGPVDLTKGQYFDQLNYKVQGLIRLWRKRLCELRDANWFLSFKRSQFDVCMNCHPCFLSVSPVSLTCKQNICPFCYGRGVQEIYRTTDTVCKGVPVERRADYWLLGYRQSLIVTEKSTDSHTALKKIFDEEKDVRSLLYERLQAVGGYIGAELEPAGDNEWRVVRRGLVLVSSQTDLSDVSDWADSVKRVKEPKGDKLAKLIGWVMKYPKRLLISRQVPRVVRLLMVKKGHRLSASYGLFRKSR